ncbi:MAG: BatD family protein, partial [Verrucomicrobiota bacterium]
IDGISVRGPKRSENTQIYNGKVSRNVIYSYRLLPLRPGEFTIKPPAYSVGGQRLNLPPIKMQVGKPGDKNASGEEESMEDYLFVKMNTDRTEVYNQEFFELFIYIYHRRVQLGNKFVPINMPERGLDIQGFQEMGKKRKKIDGEEYEVIRLKARIQALTEGTFTLNPSFKMSLMVKKQRGRSRGMFNDPFFDSVFSRYEEHPVELTPDSMKIVVKPLPEDNRPQRFSGAVGQFGFKASITPDKIKVGDPIAISMMVHGNGNIDVISTPQLQLGDAFKTYDPKLITREINKSQTSGKKVFEQVVIPRLSDVNEIPVIEFTYFDPLKNRYEVIREGPFPIDVIESTQNVDITTSGPMETRTDAKLLDKDIAYIKPAPDTWSHADSPVWYSNRTFWAAQAAPPLMLAGLLLFSVRRESLKKDVARARRQQAPKSARKAVQKAEQALNQNQEDGFFDAVWDTLVGYFGNRLNLSPGAVTTQIVVDAFSQSDTEEGLTDRIELLFSDCAAYRFGSEASGETMTPERKTQLSTMLADVNSLLQQCEKVKLG